MRGVRAVEAGQHLVHARAGPALRGQRRHGQLAPSGHGAHAATAPTGTPAGFLAFGIKIASPFFLSPAKGARTSVYLASSPEVEGVSGRVLRQVQAEAAAALGAGSRGGAAAVAGERGAGRPRPRQGRPERVRVLVTGRGPGHRSGHGRGAGRTGATRWWPRPGIRRCSRGCRRRRCLALDVSDDASVRPAVAAAGELDAVVNNAGVPGTGPLETYPLDSFSRVPRGEYPRPAAHGPGGGARLARTGERCAGQRQLGAGQDRDAAGGAVRGIEARARGALGDAATSSWATSGSGW